MKDFRMGWCMSTKAFRKLTIVLIIISFTYACASHPIVAQTTTIIPSGTSAKSTTPAPNGLGVRETERAGTVFAIQTASTTLLPSPSSTNTLTPEPTSTPKPFSKDDVLVSYTRYGGDGMDEITSCLNAYYSYRFVLYRDGRLIVFDETRYLETRITQTEIDKLLSEIDATGFSSLIGDGDQYIQSAPTPSFINGWGSSITIIEKTIGITDTQSNYLVEPVIHTLNIIDNFRPQNLKPYVPESITLWVYSEQNSPIENFYPTPDPSVLNWSTDSIELGQLVVDPFTNIPQTIYGDTLSFLIQQLKFVPSFRKIEQDGQYFLVLVCPNFQ